MGVNKSGVMLDEEKRPTFCTGVFEFVVVNKCYNPCSVRWMNTKELLSQKSGLILLFQNLPQFAHDDSFSIFQLLTNASKSLYSRDSVF